MTPIALRTDRLVLQALTPQDAPIIAASISNFNVSKWLTVVPYPYTLADAERFIDENIAGRIKARAIWHDDLFVGMISLGKELGYWLAEPAWGQGYATEAAHAVVDDHFANTDADIIHSSHFVENTGSRHVLTKLGFVDIGSHVHHSLARGQDMPGRRVELTKKRWHHLRP